MARPSASASVSWNEGALARVKARLRAKAARARDSRVTVGINEADGAKAKVNYEGETTKRSLLYVMLVHEFGGGNVPERSWFRSWFDRNANRLKLQAMAAKRAEYRGDAGAVERIAARWAAELRQWIEDDQAAFAQLAESTMRQRRAARLEEGPPLIATEQFIRAIRGYVDGRPVST